MTSSIHETSVYALETLAQHPDASRLYAVDFSGALADGEELTGTPATALAPDDGATLSEQSINTAATVNGQGQAVAAFQSALVRIAGLSAPRDYVLTVTCDTTDGNRIALQCRLIGQK